MSTTAVDHPAVQQSMQLPLVLKPNGMPLSACDLLEYALKSRDEHPYVFEIDLDTSFERCDVTKFSQLWATMGHPPIGLTGDVFALVISIQVREPHHLVLAPTKQAELHMQLGSPSIILFPDDVDPRPELEINSLFDRSNYFDRIHRELAASSAPDRIVRYIRNNAQGRPDEDMAIAMQMVRERFGVTD